MTHNESILPFYVKAGVFFIGLAALIAILYIAQGIFIPLVFGLIIAILLSPVVKLLVRWRINRIVAISLSLLLSLVLIASFFLLIYTQAVSFSESWPIFVQKLSTTINQTISSIATVLDIKPSVIHTWVSKTQHELTTIDSTLIGQTIVNVSSLVASLVLIPVYIFVLLYYQPLFVDFIHRLFGQAEQTQVGLIITQIKTVTHRYLLGLLIEIVIVALLNSVGLFLLGIEYALLLGVIGALLNLVPYLGGFIAVGLFMMVALVTKSSAWFVLYVFAVHMFIQFIDNYFIVPRIVASQVKINALFSILVVLIGNALWGIPGMFLSLPLLAIIKVIFDHIDSLAPWGYLLGDTLPLTTKNKPT